ncbi:hypothetical protein QUA79_02645 [Microcoleus sp. F8-D1]
MENFPVRSNAAAANFLMAYRLPNKILTSTVAGVISDRVVLS